MPADDEELRRIYSLPCRTDRVLALRKFAESKSKTPRICSNRAVVLGIASSRRRWSDAEYRNITRYAASHPPRAIARIVGRSERSVKRELLLLRKLGRVRSDGYTVHMLAGFMGINPETLARLVQRWPMNGRKWSKWQKFPSCDVQVWLWEHIDDLDLRPMDQVWLKRMLKEVAA